MHKTNAQGQHAAPSAKITLDNESRPHSPICGEAYQLSTTHTMPRGEAAISVADLRPKMALNRPCSTNSPPPPPPPKMNTYIDVSIFACWLLQLIELRAGKVNCSTGGLYDIGP
jgi:hypothetical protein